MPDRSHQSGSEKRRPASSRVPSGRAVDSTWRTSAPSIASTWVQSGPAQNEVRSRTRSPAYGSSSVGRGRARPCGGVGRPARRRRRARPASAPARGAEQRRVEPVGPVRLDEAVARVLDDRPARLEVVGLRDRRAVADGGVGDAEGAGELEDLGRGALGHPRRDLGLQVAAVGEQRPVLHPLGVLDHHAEVEPLLAGADAEADEAVARRLDARRHDRPTAAERPAHHVEEGHRVVGEAQHERLEHRHVDELARSAAQPTGPGDHRADGRVDAGEPLADLPADEHRRPVRSPAAETDDPARPRLQRELGGGAVAPRPLQAERA